MIRYKPKSASLVPAMIQMILEADIPRDALSSLQSHSRGAAPLDPRDAGATSRTLMEFRF